nr:MAG TPA: hypothetical protein [Caudoviricetes sp.]
MLFSEFYANQNIYSISCHNYTTRTFVRQLVTFP